LFVYVEQLAPADDGQVKQSTGPISWAMRLAKANGGKKENAAEEHPETTVESNSQSSGVRLPAGVSASACYFLECNHASTETHLSVLIFLQLPPARAQSNSVLSIQSNWCVIYLFSSVDVNEYNVNIFGIFFREREGTRINLLGTRHPRSHQKSNSLITLPQDSQKLQQNLLNVLISQIMDLTETSSLIRGKHQCICRILRCRCHRIPMLRVSSMACHTDRDIKVWVQGSIKLTFKLLFIPISDPKCPIMEGP